MDICAIIRPGCIQAESDRENALVAARIEHGRQLREVGQSVKKQADDTTRCHSAVMQGEIEAALPLPEEALVGGGGCTILSDKPQIHCHGSYRTQLASKAFLFGALPRRANTVVISDYYHIWTYVL
jgi:hypothetical protein